MSTAFVRLDKVCRYFWKPGLQIQAVQNVSLQLGRGEFVILRGRSGSGKTTLLNLIGGLDRPTAGTISIDDTELSQLSDAQLTTIRRHRIGLVFQSFGVLPYLSVRENVELPLRMIGCPGSERIKRVNRWLEHVGLQGRAEHRPAELSGGEQQRTALARALAVQPDLLLADEPTSQLDSNTADHMIQLIRNVARETDMTVCMTTHDPGVLRSADVICTMEDGSLREERAQ